MYDQDGQLVVRAGLTIARPPGSPTPCQLCPKCSGSKVKSAEVGRTAELSRRNWKTWKLFNEVQACGPGDLKLDAVARKNFGILHQLVKEDEKREMIRLRNAIEGGRR